MYVGLLNDFGKSKNPSALVHMMSRIYVFNSMDVLSL